MERHLNSDYLDLLEKILLYSFWPELNMDWNGNLQSGFVCDEQRESGQTAWPSKAFTMINRLRLRNIRDLCSLALSSNVPGGFCECGAWRGGASIYARACMPMDRPVYVCDSFCGFPPDEPETHWTTYKVLSVSQSEVESNFKKFGLLENVIFVPGYFKTSLVNVTNKLAVLRIDADSHASTLTVLESLWPKLSAGGFVICDDYKVCGGAKKAFIDYFGIEPSYTEVDCSAIWFQKT